MHFFLELMKESDPFHYQLDQLQVQRHLRVPKDYNIQYRILKPFLLLNSFWRHRRDIQFQKYYLFLLKSYLAFFYYHRKQSKSLEKTIQVQADIFLSKYRISNLR